MEDKYVITVGRQFGSGGREIGRKLATRLGIGYYDKELLSEIQKETGLSPSFIAKSDEQPLTAWSHALAGLFYDGIPAQEQIFRYQSDIVRKIAEKESCVIVGRCADYILRDYPHCVNVFIHAPLAFCVERLFLNDGIPWKEGAELAVKMNKKRSTYYNFYTDKKWGSINSYHLSIDSSLLGIDPTVELIATLVEQKMGLK
ncbi:MAG: cytidylate kinase-like family protein [Rikenellaceae bacterium]|nr:cytidylate kinase-like family protein [Rikenellaceae bacterium]